MAAQQEKLPTLTGVITAESNGFGEYDVPDEIRKGLTAAVEARNANKAANRINGTFAIHAAEVNEVTDANVIRTYERAFSDINQAVRTEGIEIQDREYAVAVMADVVPALLRINEIGQFNNSSGYNSHQQVVSVALQFLRAPEVKATGGRFIILSQMCAQYASREGRAGDVDTWESDGLVEQINTVKVNTVMSPFQRMAAIPAKFGIPVEIQTLQLAPDPKLMPILEPSTVWGYVIKGRTVEMLERLGEHFHQFPEIATPVINPDNNPNITHATFSYATEDGEYPSVIDRAYQITQLVDDALTFRRETINKRRAENHLSNDGNEKPLAWKDLTLFELKQFLDYYDDTERMTALINHQKQNGWTDYHVRLFNILHSTMSMPTSGTADAFRRFYNREALITAKANSRTWHEKLDHETEVQELLSHPSFYPDLEQDERHAEAVRLMDGVDLIASMETGGNAVINTALYMSIGERVAALNFKDGNRAVVIPIEESSQQWAVWTMQQVWEANRPANGSKTSKTVPLLYPRQSQRQPFR